MKLRFDGQPVPGSYRSPWCLARLCKIKNNFIRQSSIDDIRQARQILASVYCKLAIDGNDTFILCPAFHDWVMQGGMNRASGWPSSSTSAFRDINSR